MANATDAQVQNYADQRVRPRSEEIRNLYNSMKDDKALLDNIYTALTQPTPTWSDMRTDNPPHLLSPADVLAWNAFVTAFISLVEGSEAGDFATVRKACVKSA
jgi:hypothetical protein